jgi:hypothetical protein
MCSNYVSQVFKGSFRKCAFFSSGIIGALAVEETPPPDVLCVPPSFYIY